MEKLPELDSKYVERLELLQMLVAAGEANDEDLAIRGLGLLLAILEEHE